MKNSNKYQTFSKRNIAKGIVWRFGERILAQLVTFVVSVVLARKITPSEFGNVALLLIFIDIANVFVVHGFATALVQKKDTDDVDFSSVLYFGLVFGLLFYTIAFIGAPLLAKVGDEALPSLFRVLALRIPLASINSVQHAYVEKHMLFKKFFYSTLIGTIISAFVGIVMAYSGCGAWSIIGQYLTNSTIDTLVLSFSIGWRPVKKFDVARLKSLLGFGWKMLLSQLIHVIYSRLSSFFIGTTYSTADIAYYEQGQKIPGILETNIDTTINSVLFPAMSNAQDDIEKLKNMVRRSIRTSSCIIWPMMIGLFVLSYEIIQFVYSDKWLPAAVYMMIACIKLGFEPIQTANLQAIKAVGRSDLYLRMEIIKKTYGLITIIICVNISVLAIALAAASQSFFSIIVNGYVNNKLFSYKIKEQITDVFYNFVLSIVMGMVVYFAALYMPNGYAYLFIDIIIGIISYSLLLYLFQREQFKFVLSIMKLVFR